MRTRIYDAPPACHALRISFTDMKGDTILQFEHDTAFTDIQITTAVNDILELQGLKALPNPFTNMIHLAIELSSGANMEINLYDIYGKSVGILWKAVIPAGNNQMTLDELENLAKGTYILNLKSVTGGNASVVMLK